MATPSADYRWQDHVPRLGSFDRAVIALTAALLLGAAAAGWPDVRAVARPAHDRIAARAVDDCGGALAAGLDRLRRAPGEEDV